MVLAEPLWTSRTWLWRPLSRETEQVPAMGMLLSTLSMAYQSAGSTERTTLGAETVRTLVEAMGPENSLLGEEMANTSKV